MQDGSNRLRVDLHQGLSSSKLPGSGLLLGWQRSGWATCVARRKSGPGDSVAGMRHAACGRASQPEISEAGWALGASRVRRAPLPGESPTLNDLRARISSPGLRQPSSNGSSSVHLYAALRTPCLRINQAVRYSVQTSPQTKPGSGTQVWRTSCALPKRPRCPAQTEINLKINKDQHAPQASIQRHGTPRYIVQNTVYGNPYGG